MSIELGFTLAILTAVVLLVVHARWTLPPAQFVPEAVEVGHVAAELPPPKPHDVLDDYAMEMGFEALTAEGSVEHRLALLDALLNEADNETSRLETLVDKMGRSLLPTA